MSHPALEKCWFPPLRCSLRGLPGLCIQTLALGQDLHAVAISSFNDTPRVRPGDRSQVPAPSTPRCLSHSSCGPSNLLPHHLHTPTSCRTLSIPLAGSACAFLRRAPPSHY